MAGQRLSRLPAMLAAAVLAVVIAAGASAQSPPPPPHHFWGSAAAGSGAVLDGAPAPDGAEITAWSLDGVAVAKATISGGEWGLGVPRSDAHAVVFTIDGSLRSAAFEVHSGQLTEVSLNLSLHLPVAGSGGLADSGAGVPVMALIFTISMLAGVVGVMAVRRLRA